MKQGIYLLIAMCILVLASCSNKNNKPPYQLDMVNTSMISIPYEETGGVKIIPVKLNGVTMDMIYDTGASGLHLSLNEVQTLAKNGKLTDEDVLGDIRMLQRTEESCNEIKLRRKRAISGCNQIQ